MSTDHSVFGGNIEIEDFNTSSPNKRRISNQMEAVHFQETLEKRKHKAEKEKKYKSMNLKELRKMRLISNTDGRPSEHLTDETWQNEFELRKLFITPYSSKTKKLGGRFSRESTDRSEDNPHTYDGCTNWQSYCSFINDILYNIRGGQVDYCYYIYQIMDLAKFHLHDLKTRYCDGYWEVWLDPGKRQEEGGSAHE